MLQRLLLGLISVPRHEVRLNMDDKSPLPWLLTIHGYFTLTYSHHHSI